MWFRQWLIALPSIPRSLVFEISIKAHNTMYSFEFPANTKGEKDSCEDTIVYITYQMFSDGAVGNKWGIFDGDVGLDYLHEAPRFLVGQ